MTARQGNESADFCFRVGTLTPALTCLPDFSEGLNANRQFFARQPSGRPRFKADQIARCAAEFDPDQCDRNTGGAVFLGIVPVH
jgi:hypothetical protein